MGTTMQAMTSQFEVYVSQYKSSCALILKGAAAQFRDDAILDEQLAALKTSFESMDQMIGALDSEHGALTAAQKVQITLLGKKLPTQIQAITSLFPHMESADLQYIQSVKVATLDQPALKGLAKQLKSVDKIFSENLHSMISDHAPPSEKDPVWNIDPMDADGQNAVNLSEPDEPVSTHS